MNPGNSHYDLNSPKNLNFYERKVYSQNGEDGIIEEIFRRIGTTNKFSVEFGVEDGKECNTRYLLEKKGWNGLRMDGGKDNPTTIKSEYITAENVNDLFAKYKVPKEPDLVSIDIDSNDYWVWKALDPKYNARLVVIEYNSTIPATRSLTVRYDPKWVWDGSNYFGASLLALYKLGRSKDYTLVACDRRGVNAFFVRDDVLAASANIAPRTPAEAYMPPGFGRKDRRGNWKGHFRRRRLMQRV